jgi:hypothetical protein
VDDDVVVASSPYSYRKMMLPMCSLRMMPIVLVEQSQAWSRSVAFAASIYCRIETTSMPPMMMMMMMMMMLPMTTVAVYSMTSVYYDVHCSSLHLAAAAVATKIAIIPTPLGDSHCYFCQAET